MPVPVQRDFAILLFSCAYFPVPIFLCSCAYLVYAILSVVFLFWRY